MWCGKKSVPLQKELKTMAKAKPFIKNEKDNFFDVLYGAYNRTRIYEQNGMPNIVIRNYSKSNSDSL